MGLVTEMTIFKNSFDFPSIQWQHTYQPSLIESIKFFGGVQQYFNTLKQCGLWDFDNDCMLEDHYETCGKRCKKTDRCKGNHRIDDVTIST